MKNAEAAISSRRGRGVKSLRPGRGVKKFYDWGVTDLGGGLLLLGWGQYLITLHGENPQLCSIL